MSSSAVPNLKKFRTDRRLTQAQLGEALGIAGRTILRWENGTGEPGARELLTLARYFNIGIDQLISDLLPDPVADSTISVAQLNGRDLDFWVARVRGLAVNFSTDGPVLYEPGQGQLPVPLYSSDWLAGGPLVIEERIHLQPISKGIRFNGSELHSEGWLARCTESAVVEYGEHPLTAGMRAIVAKALGVTGAGLIGAAPEELHPRHD